MTFRYEDNKYQQGYRHVIGCDEVGRGSLAGPVVAAAIVLPQEIHNSNIEFRKIKDSKLLNPEKRQKLSAIIKQHALWAVGVVSQHIIDKINIHNATLLAMRRAVIPLLSSFGYCEPQAKQSNDRFFAYAQNDAKPQIAALSRGAGLARNDSLIAIDGRFTIPDLSVPQEAIINGDNKVLSIAAASILAKVYRDSLMTKYHQKYPLYNFAQHKGYGTLYHRQTITEYGLSPLHRLSFCGNLAI